MKKIFYLNEDETDFNVVLRTPSDKEIEVVDLKVERIYHGKDDEKKALLRIKELLKLFIVGWDKLTNKELGLILNPERDWKYRGTKDKDGLLDSKFIIEFNPENLNFVLKHMDQVFVSWILACRKMLKTEALANKEKQLKN